MKKKQAKRNSKIFNEDLNIVKITKWNFFNYKIFDMSNNQLKRWNFYSETIYFIPATTWGKCSKKCNGGLRHRELKCIDKESTVRCPSKKYFQKEECNTDPCPVNKKMKVQVRQVFSSPQKFIKCIVKEGDVYYVRRDVKSIGTQPLIPVRVVVTNKYFSVMLSRKQAILELSLDSISCVKRCVRNPTCFMVYGSNKSVYKFCQLGTGPHSTAKEWIKDLIEFKTICNVYGKSASNNPFKINFNQYNKLYDYYGWSDKEALMQHMMNNSRKEDLSRDQDLLMKKMQDFIDKSDKLLAKLKQYELRKQNERSYQVLQIKEEIRQLLIKEKAVGDNIAASIKMLDKDKKFNLNDCDLKKNFDKKINEIKSTVNRKKLELANRSIIAEKSVRNIHNDQLLTLNFYKQHSNALDIKRKKLLRKI